MREGQEGHKPRKADVCVFAVRTVLVCGRLYTCRRLWLTGCVWLGPTPAFGIVVSRSAPTSRKRRAPPARPTIANEYYNKSKPEPTQPTRRSALVPATVSVYKTGLRIDPRARSTECPHWVRFEYPYPHAAKANASKSN